MELVGDRTIGTVEEVHADKITVLLAPNAPQSTALNTGMPAGFPRVNGYVVIPNEHGSTVCMVSSVRINRLPLPPAQTGGQELVRLPVSSRVMTLTPLGTVTTSSLDEMALEVRRGIDVLPAVGDPVLLPDGKQLEAIVEGESRTEQRIRLGTSPVARYAPVYVDPDRLFGRHLAVLGNTGAGKSCSVAGLIRWSLEAARAAHDERADPQTAAGRFTPNARFIVLDPNGEYAKAFDDFDVRVFRVEPRGAKRLNVPAWLWNGDEWAAFTEASPGVQRPLLIKALRRLRAGAGLPTSFESRASSILQVYRNIFRVAHEAKDNLRFPKYKDVKVALESASKELDKLSEIADDDRKDSIARVKKACDDAAAAGKGQRGYDQAIDAGHMMKLLDELDMACSELDIPEMYEVNEDVPRRFCPMDLPDYIDALAALSSGRDMAQFVDTLNLRIRSLLGHQRLASILDAEDSFCGTLGSWLTDYIGADGASNGPVAVVDLSLVPSEVTHVVVSVLARMAFEAVQRYRRESGKELPTTIVLEEAHTFVHRGLVSEGASAAGRACVGVFERIAREGRKFGLGLVIASQRPSEVAPTVLSQCNTFLLHRIVNDRDQELVRRLVPDGLGDLLRELPSLPTRRAILLGWATPAPTLVQIREVPNSHRPHSPDPAFWDVWTGRQKRPIDWDKIARGWQGRSNDSS